MRPLLLYMALAGCAPDRGPATVPVDHGSHDDSHDDSSDSGDSGIGSAADSEFVALEGARLLRRLSLDLRGILPSVDEMAQVEADPAAFAELRAAFQADSHTEEQLVKLLAEHFLTTPDYYLVEYDAYLLEADQDYAWKRSIGQEPLRLMARVILEDRRWSEVVTADHTMATEITAALWPVEGYPEGETGWHPVTWTDGRPAAGVLASNGLWWRYVTDDFNLQRSRAAAISKLLTCEDLLARDVSFENAAALLDKDTVAEMVRTDASCLACHATVEPLAATLFGFRWVSGGGVQEMERYHPEREVEGEPTLEVTMAYWGEPVSGLGDVGQALSRDPRYYSCAAETFTGLLLRRPTESTDRHDLLSALESLVDAEGRVWPMIETITDTPAYRAGGFSEFASDETRAREFVVRPLSPAQLAASVEELTGFRWTYVGYDQLDSDTWGYRIQLGGVDGFHTTIPVLEPSLGHALTTKRFAEGAAAYTVAEHLGDGGDTLLGGVTPGTVPGDAAFDERLADIWWRLTALPADAEVLATYADLWSAVNDVAGEDIAWQATLTALLQDPLFVSY